MASHAEKNICKKTGFKNEKEANTKLEEIKKYPTKIQKKDLRYAYKCEYCGLWHLTSMSKNLFKTIDKNKKERDSIVNVPKDVIEKRIKYLESVNSFKNKFKQ